MLVQVDVGWLDPVGHNRCSHVGSMDRSWTLRTSCEVTLAAQWLTHNGLLLVEDTATVLDERVRRTVVIVAYGRA